MGFAPIRPYAESIGLMAATAGLGLVTDRALHTANIDIVFVLVVLVIALRWGRRPALFTALVSAAVFVFCFVPPYYTIAISDLAYLTTLIGFLVVAIATSELASRARRL